MTRTSTNQQQAERYRLFRSEVTSYRITTLDAKGKPSNTYKADRIDYGNLAAEIAAKKIFGFYTETMS